MSGKSKLEGLAITGEEALLHRIRQELARRARTTPRARRDLRVAIGDDAAVLRAGFGSETVLTCDWFLQGTHFLLDRHPPDAVGWKCLARAVSDLAAMGASPRCFLLSLALPSRATGRWLNGFLRGLQAASRHLRCPAAGGDTTRSERVLINVTAVGECRRGRALLRNGARPGDLLFVTGRLGEAEYGLRQLRAAKRQLNPREPHLRKHLYPEPRLAVGSWLAERGLATAAMDLSDGLSTDLPRLCAASGVGARIEQARLPSVNLPNAASSERLTAVSLALHGGDDYELLFSVKPRNAARIPRAISGVAITLIGEITRGRKIALIPKDGSATPLTNRGWDPFRPISPLP